jgi:membrane-associated phospholipid phosphatase
MPCVQANHGQQRPVEPPETAASRSCRDWREDVRRLDVAVYAAVAATPTPTLDRFFGRVSAAADHSRIWLVTAGVLAAVGDGPGRSAAADGVVSIGLTSAVVNLVLKPLGDRRRPNRDTYGIPIARQVAMPRSTSFPSGHAASAFAFATGVGYAMPALGLPLHATAAVVAYSRVHTGVHYPADVVVGAAAGAALGQVAVALRRRSPLQRGRGR